ncbi:MAG: GNAT family N-acetyltransferase [Deltaproteobacteria bacterium]|nr:GNAT family N-acetyltransferase [Deltaproteobacteria bacterium]
MAEYSMQSNCEDYSFRELVPDDAPQFRNLRLDALTTSSDVLAATLEEVEADSEGVVRQDIDARIRNGGFSVGAFSKQLEMVGMVNVARPSLERLRHIGCVWGVYVSTEHRNRGLARELLLELIRLARNIEDLHQLHIEVVTSNASAVRLYQEVGFECYGTQPRAIRTNEGYHDEYQLALILR